MLPLAVDKADKSVVETSSMLVGLQGLRQDIANNRNKKLEAQLGAKDGGGSFGQSLGCRHRK